MWKRLTLHEVLDFLFAVVIPVILLFGMAFAALSVVLWMR